MRTTVVSHSADWDGRFCAEIARKFLPDAELIGWDFGDAPLPVPEGQIYVLDLPVDRPFGMTFVNPPEQAGNPVPQELLKRIVWLDHHRSSIDSHPKDIPGYRIDGVSACRLAWQWFKAYCTDKDSCDYADCPTAFCDFGKLPTKQDFIDRKVSEPFAVCLAGEYDIWCKADSRAELFQHGLRSEDVTWDALLVNDPDDGLNPYIHKLLDQGRALQYAKTKENASIIKHNGFTMHWEGLCFLACNAARYNSLLFTAGLKPEHDACFGFNWTGKAWAVSLYHAPGKEHIDLSVIATRYGGGGHRGACGFQSQTLPFGLHNIPPIP